MEFFDSLEPFLRTYWFIALPTSLIFIIQTAMTFIGVDASDGLSADFDGNLDGGDAPFQLFSFRNLINFLLGFSWSGISFYDVIPNKTILLLVALAVGISFVLVFFYIMRQIQKLPEDNTFNIEEAVGKTAEVYLTIPEKMSGKGKVMISVRGSFHELPAMTENEKITTNSMIKVVRIESNEILIVEQI
ncbi:MAG: serine protease [Flavobacteriales bacterium]|nr:serine protease [Flavobacteriales bacterium]